MTVVSPSQDTSTTMMHVLTVFSIPVRPNLSLMSRTGTTLPSQVDDAPHVVGGFGHLCHRGEFQYLPHVGDIEGKDFFAKLEGEVLSCIGYG